MKLQPEDGDLLIADIENRYSGGWLQNDERFNVFPPGERCYRLCGAGEIKVIVTGYFVPRGDIEWIEELRVWVLRY